jgi:hypothetical protein
MKTKLTWIALALAAAGTLGAQAQEEGGRRGGNRAPNPEAIKEFDKDGDGKLSDEEAKAMREAMQARRAEAQKKELEEFDKDKDGKLSDEERKAAQEAREAKHKALVEKYDADKNGELSREEIQTAVKAGEEMRYLRPGPARGGRGGEGGAGGGGRRGGRGGEGAPKPEEKKEEAKPAGQ